MKIAGTTLFLRGFFTDFFLTQSLCRKTSHKSLLNIYDSSCLKNWKDLAVNQNKHLEVQQYFLITEMTGV